MNEHLKTNTIYMLGIGGIGMSALARYFRRQGKEVSGYDHAETPLTRQLETEGMNIHYRDDPAYIPCDAGLVIYTPAIPSTNRELTYCKEVDFVVRKRAEVLGMIAEDMDTIAVAGTHGKTTISSMIAHILHSSGMPITGFIGGIMNNYESNLLDDPGSRYLVAEADEYDRSFHYLQPWIAVVSAVSADHLDIYGSEEALIHSFSGFIERIRAGGTLVVHESVKHMFSLPPGTIVYGHGPEAHLRITNVRVEEHRYHFDLSDGHNTTSISMLVPGVHNIENATAAAAACLRAGLGMEDIKNGLETFRGVKRRFEYIIDEDDLVFIDDYAHHPEEITACISTARTLYPGKKITGVFQPHLYSRTRDLADAFASSLGQLDEVILLDIYPAREEPIAGVDAQMLADRIGISRKTVSTKKDLAGEILNRRPEVLITMGAGDIDQLIGIIKDKLKDRK
jgi:UDP-N-acetylmuramate--alanine ligase